MRTEQVKSNLFVVKPGKVEQHLLKTVKRFMEEDDGLDPRSREAMIEEASRRARNDTLIALKKVIIEETREYAKNEMKPLIQEALASILDDFEEKMEEQMNKQIQQRSFRVYIDEPSTEIFVPDAIKIHNTKDIVFLSINGIDQPDYITDVDSKGYIRKFKFEDVVLLEEDVVLVKAILINPTA